MYHASIDNSANVAAVSPVEDSPAPAACDSIDHTAARGAAEPDDAQSSLCAALWAY